MARKAFCDTAVSTSTNIAHLVLNMEPAAMTGVHQLDSKPDIGTTQSLDTHHQNVDQGQHEHDV